MAFIEDLRYRPEHEKRERAARHQYTYVSPSPRLTPLDRYLMQRADRIREASAAFPGLLQQYGAYLHPSFSLTAQSAFFQWLEKPTTPLPTLLSWSPETASAHHPRTNAIEQALLQFNKANEASQPRWIACVDLLLGPRLHEARATASHTFFNPVQHFYQAAFGMIGRFIQDTVAHQQQNPDYAYGDLKLCYQTYPLLATGLAELIKTYQQAFPFEAKTFQEAMNTWFVQGEWPYSLIELLDNAHKKLSSFGGLLENYTLTAMEDQAFFKERQRYEKALRKHLTTYPEDRALFLAAASLDEEKNIDSTDAEKQAELIQVFSFLPAQLPWAFSDHYMNHGHAPVLFYETFLAHGADITHLKPVISREPLSVAWAVLKAAVTYDCPDSPLDGFVRKNLATYCKEPHEPARWHAIVDALRDTNNPTPFTQRLVDTCKNYEQYRPRSSRLFQAAKQAQAYLPKPTLKPILLSFYTCFAENKPPLNAATTLYLTATIPWEPLLKQLSPDITTLAVDASWFPTDNRARALQVLSPYFRYVQHLSFSHTGLTDDLLYTLITVWGYIDNPRKTIETLDLSYNLLTDEGLKKIASRLSRWPTLKTVNLTGNLITAEGIESLIAVLPQTTITTLRSSVSLEESLNFTLTTQLSLNAQKSETASPVTPLSDVSGKTSPEAGTISEKSDEGIDEQINTAMT